MPRYVWRDGRMIDKDTGEEITRDPNAPVCLPQIRGDLPGYLSPVTGQWVEGRAARREDLARSGCREVDPSEWHGEYRKEKYERNSWEARQRRI